MPIYRNVFSHVLINNVATHYRYSRIITSRTNNGIPRRLWITYKPRYLGRTLGLATVSPVVTQNFPHNPNHIVSSVSVGRVYVDG